MGNYKSNEIQAMLENYIDNPLLLGFLAASPYKSNFRFPIYVNRDYWDQDIEGLDLDTRAINCLHRTGVMTIRGILGYMNGSKLDTATLRGLGKSTQKRIMVAIFVYQYQHLKPKEIPQYIKSVMDLN